MAEKIAKKIKAETPLSERQQEIFIKYYPVVRKVVNSMRSKLPSYADLDELHSAGVAGLADAIKRLDLSREDTFDSYIATRIRGSVIDELRSLDYMSRSARNDAKNIEKLRNRLEQKLSRTPLESEMRKAMGVSERQYNKIMRRTQSLSFISLNERTDSDDTSAPSVVESVADTHSPSPLKQIETTEMYKEIRENIANLPEKQRRVLDSYYFKDMELSDIAKEFGLTEARICQIHSQALRNLRPKLSN